MPHTIKSFSASLSTHDQSMKQIAELLARVGGRAGCDHCGRIAFIAVQFAGDPGPEYRGLGVTSFNEIG